MKRPETKFHADTMCGSKVIRSKKPKFIVRSKCLAAQFFSLSIFYWSYYNRYWHAFASFISDKIPDFLRLPT